MTQGGRRSGCPINFALEIFGDAWSLLVIRDLMFTGKKTYTEFLNSDEGIATNILADRLRRLEDAGLISRRGTGRRAAYALTDKGLDLLPVMLAIVSWSVKYDRDTAADPAFLAQLRKDRVGFARRLRRGLEMAHGLGVWSERNAHP